MATRTRSRTDLIVQSYTGDADVLYSTRYCWAAMSNKIDVHQVLTYDNPHNYSLITDEECSDVCNKRKFKPVSHIRYNYTNIGLISAPGGTGPRYGNCDSYGRVQYVNFKLKPSSATTTLDRCHNFFDDSSHLLNGFYTQEQLFSALDRIRPSLEKLGAERTNVYTMLLELGDMKKLIPGIKESLATANTAAAISSNAAGAWLTWNWGIVPVVGDVKTLFSLADRVDKAIDKWNNFAARGKVMNFHETISRGQVQAETDTYSVRTDADASGSNIIEAGAGEYTAKLHLYVKPKLVLGADRFRLHTRALGLDMPLTGIWEAIPFSWLIDYVTTIGDAIASMERSTEQLFKYTIIDAGLSEKVNKYYERRKTDHWYAGSFLSGHETIEYESYHRHSLPGSIFTSYSLDVAWDPSLSPTELTNLAAVARRFWH